MTNLAIIGGGFSGTACLAEIMRRYVENGSGELNITIFDKAAFGGGNAFGVACASYRLNTLPKEIWSPEYEGMDDFKTWYYKQGGDKEGRHWNARATTLISSINHLAARLTTAPAVARSSTSFRA